MISYSGVQAGPFRPPVKDVALGSHQTSSLFDSFLNTANQLMKAALLLFGIMGGLAVLVRLFGSTDSLSTTTTSSSNALVPYQPQTDLATKGLLSISNCVVPGAVGAMASVASRSFWPMVMGMMGCLPQVKADCPSFLSEQYVYDPGRIFIDGSLAYVSSNYRGEGVAIVSISNPSSISSIGYNYQENTFGISWGSLRGYGRVTANGTTAYITNHNRIDIVDMSAPQNPTFNGNIASTSMVWGMAGKFLCANRNSAATGWALKLEFLNFESSVIVVAASYPNSDNTIQDIAFSASYTYMAVGRLGNAGGGGLRIFSAAPSLTLIGGYNTPGIALSVAVNGSTVFVADGSSLQIVDITNPALPIFLATYSSLNNNYPDSGSIGRVSVGDSVVGFTDYPSAVFLNTADPRNPILIGRYTPTGTSSVRDIWINGSIAYLAIGGSYSIQDGLRAYDIGGESCPTPQPTTDSVSNRPTTQHQSSSSRDTALAEEGNKFPVWAMAVIPIGSAAVILTVIGLVVRFRRGGEENEVPAVEMADKSREPAEQAPKN